MLKKYFIAILLLITSLHVAAFPGETRRYFKDWLVNCLNDANNTCRSVTHVRNKALFPYSDGTIFQFIIQQQPATNGTETEIIFYHVLDNAYPADNATFIIDDIQSFRFKLLASESLNERKLSQKDTESILNGLKKGHTLTIQYTSQSKEPVEVKISLRGITAALLFAEEHINK
ncbi:hypothetical protein [Zooshikella sp. RANM57]|uniref:hypothetical protein n=1 Tax=Zooshikella sp. RANM57 TaxID=3425863 RepID=UPI003D6DF9F0